MALAWFIPKSTLHENLDIMGIKVRYHKFKLYQTKREYNKKQRVKCKIEYNSSAQNNMTTSDSFEDVININKKWFFTCKMIQKYYLFDKEN